MDTYEKKYKEALERARIWKDKSGMPKDKQGILDDIFPELKESEDEKIRKALLELVHDTTGDELWVDYNVHKEDALAWLEKQGEHKVSVVDFKAKDWYVSKVDGKIHNITYNPTEKKELKESDNYCRENCKGFQETGKCFADGDCRDKREAERKSAWSEEDEKKRNLLISILNVNHPNGLFKVNPANTLNMEAMPTEELVEWLKSLRPHNTWRPSNEQMLALKHAFNDCSIAFADMKILATLYEQLKALHRYEQNT